MKRYLKHPKPAKLTKNQMRRRLQIALEVIEPISREKCNLRLQNSALAGRIAELQSEVRTFREALNNVTRPVRHYFRCDRTESKMERIMPEQRLTGSYQIVMRQVIDAADIRMRLDENDWVEAFARLFAREAYESAKKHLKLTR